MANCCQSRSEVKLSLFCSRLSRHLGQDSLEEIMYLNGASLVK